MKTALKSEPISFPDKDILFGKLIGPAAETLRKQVQHNQSSPARPGLRVATGCCAGRRSEAEQGRRQSHRVQCLGFAGPHVEECPVTQWGAAVSVYGSFQMLKMLKGKFAENPYNKYI